jgi:hypothetical protein
MKPPRVFAFCRGGASCCGLDRFAAGGDDVGGKWTGDETSIAAYVRIEYGVNSFRRMLLEPYVGVVLCGVEVWSGGRAKCSRQGT